MRMALMLLIAVSLVACSSQPRFVPIGGSTNTYVMFDNETAQACYSGPLDALYIREHATHALANLTTSLSTPHGIVANYFPENKGSAFTPAEFLELTNLSNTTGLRWKKTAQSIRWRN
jgi:hypothetical protein